MTYMLFMTVSAIDEVVDVDIYEIEVFDLSIYLPLYILYCIVVAY